MNNEYLHDKFQRNTNQEGLEQRHASFIFGVDPKGEYLIDVSW